MNDWLFRAFDTGSEPQTVVISLEKDTVSMTTWDAHLLFFA